MELLGFHGFPSKYLLHNLRHFSLWKKEKGRMAKNELHIMT